MHRLDKLLKEIDAQFGFDYQITIRRLTMPNSWEIIVWIDPNEIDITLIPALIDVIPLPFEGFTTSPQGLGLVFTYVME